MNKATSPSRGRRAALGLLAATALLAGGLAITAPAAANTYPLGDVPLGPNGIKCDYALADLTIARGVTASQPLEGATFEVSVVSVDGTGGQPRFLSAAWDVNSAENVAWRAARDAFAAFMGANPGVGSGDPTYDALVATVESTSDAAKASNGAATYPGPVTVTTDASGMAAIPTMVFPLSCDGGVQIVTTVTVTETVASPGYQLDPTPLVANLDGGRGGGGSWVSVNGFDDTNELFYLLGGETTGTGTGPINTAPNAGTFPVVSG